MTAGLLFYENLISTDSNEEADEKALNHSINAENSPVPERQ